jgi:Reverse transcriptase (RNA-dependent DNA polymerase)
MYCPVRFPDGSIRKLKARFCVRGDRQREGIDYFDTYAPVVNWQTVRLMLVLSIILGLATKQADNTAAFVHAPIDRDPNWENLTEEEK